MQPLSDINGDYSSGGLAAGTYRVFFGNNGLDYVSEWYSDRYALWTAADVTVLAGSTTSNVNANLASGGATISGRVSNAGGAWAQISGANPELVVAANINLDQETEIAADFGTIGVRVWNNGVWNQISASNPENIIAKY